MDDRIAALERRVETLERQVQRLAGRLTPEATGGEEPPVAAAEAASAPAAPPALPAEEGAGWPALAGRTLIVLGGAFLLRAASDAALLPLFAGACLGLVYAAHWLWRADRDARAGRRPSAVFHGLTALAVALPLLWETTVRMRVFPAEAGAAGVAAVLLLGVAVALRRDLEILAWATVLASLAAGVGLLVATRALLPFATSLLLVAAALEALAPSERWRGLRWPAAAAVNVAVLVFAQVHARSEGLPAGYAPVARAAALALPLALGLLYAASLAWRLWRGGTTTGLDAVQVPLAALLGFGGALRIHPPAAPLVAGLCLFLGALAYVAALTGAGRTGSAQPPRLPATLGGLFVSAGLLAGLPPAPRAVAWSALALAAAALRPRAQTLGGHAVVYLLAAALDAGAPATVARAWGGTNLAASAVLGSAAVSLLAFGIYLLLGRGSRGRPFAAWRAVGRAFTLAVGGSLAAALTVWVAAALVPLPRGRAGAAVMTVLRTAVLLGFAVALAWRERRRPAPELAWLGHAVMAVAAAKLLLDDLRRGQPATLFLSLSLYGAALWFLPRLRRRAPEPPAEVS